MTVYDEILGKLQKFPDFRERQSRQKYLVTLTLRSLGLEFKQKDSPLSVENLIDFSRRYDTYRHQWDKVMAENPELQGKDYGDKDRLEQEVMLERGYIPGFRESVNKSIAGSR